MPSPGVRFVPGVLLALGSGLLAQAGRQEVVQLRRPLETLPDSALGYGGTDQTLDRGQVQVAGTSSYLLRNFGTDSTFAFSLYVGYYDSQTQGRTIHSPKNCLPGAGWEVISASDVAVPVGTGQVMVNRYVVGKDLLRAVVYYWYQGRGRVSSNEYVVKWELLRDKAIAGRSEEALVRIVVPVWTEEAAADSLATAAASMAIPAVSEVLPEYRAK